MSNKINKLTIKGFKSIRNLDQLRLNRLNVLIGANGAGKSNLVSYFQMLSEMVEQRLQVWTKKQGGADRILSYGVKETSQLESFVKFGRNGYSFLLTPTADGGFTFSDESVFNGGYAEKWFPLGSGHSEAKLKKSSSDVAHNCFSAISGWKVFHFHDTSDTAGVKRLCSVHDNEYLRPDASNLAAFLYKLRLKRPDMYSEIRKVISLAIPFFDDFVLKPQALPTEEEQIRLLWKEKDSDYSLWPSQLSDGSIRFICLATALLQPYPPSTIIIDEPELGLHPYALTLLGALIRTALHRMQVIVSTQSVPLLNEFSVDDLIVVERQDGASVFKRLDEKEFQLWLEDYTIGELWEKNVFGGRPGK
jgi:predicted ATPase